MFTHATDGVACILTSGFHFIIRVRFNLAAKKLNISRHLPLGISSPSGFITIIVIIFIVIVIVKRVAAIVLYLALVA